MSFRWLLWSLASPSQLLIAITVAGALLQWFTRGSAGPPTRWARVGLRLTLIGGIGLLLFGLLPASHYLAYALEARFPVPQLPRDVQGIILLSGAERPALSDAYGQPLLGSSGSRYVATLRLAQRFPRSRVVYSGGSKSAPGKGPLGTQSAVAAAILGHVGLDAKRVSFDVLSRDTCDHPRNVRELVKPEAGDKWVVVTSAMHMPRTIACFQAEGWGDVIPYATDQKVALTSWGLGSFQVAKNLEWLDMAVHEWIGLLYYRLSGRTQTLLP